MSLSELKKLKRLAKAYAVALHIQSVALACQSWSASNGTSVNKLNVAPALVKQHAMNLIMVSPRLDGEVPCREIAFENI